MRYLLPLVLLFTACNQVDTTMQNELAQLKEKLAAAEQAVAAANTDETAFIHTVFFWMKDGVTDEQKADFVANGMGKLKDCPQIYKVFYGPPAGTPREVVDNSYDYAWVCHFKSKADQDAYQTEPIHLKFIEDYKDLWGRVQVYDNVLSE
ncbi:MAG: Dabb family protein [Bacteroidota bacterium]